MSGVNRQNNRSLIRSLIDGKVKSYIPISIKIALEILPEEKILENSIFKFINRYNKILA